MIRTIMSALKIFVNKLNSLLETFNEFKEQVETDMEIQDKNTAENYEKINELSNKLTDKVDINIPKMNSPLNVGNTSFVSSSSFMGVGDDARASGLGSLALGARSQTSNDYAISIGEVATANGRFSFSFGRFTETMCNNSMALGFGAKTQYGLTNYIAIGSCNKVLKRYAVNETYQQGNVVFNGFDSKYYMALTNNIIGIRPDTDSTKWREMERNEFPYLVVGVGQVAAGDTIDSGYIRIEKDGFTVYSDHVEDSNGKLINETDIATTSKAGIMSAQDKARLDELYSDYLTASQLIGG